MKITIDDWISLLIGIAVVAGAYYYLTNATAEREVKMFNICMEDNVDEIKGDAERASYCFGVMGKSDD